MFFFVISLVLNIKYRYYDSTLVDLHYTGKINGMEKSVKYVQWAMLQAIKRGLVVTTMTVVKLTNITTSQSS